jgi:hypothetical protein
VNADTRERRPAKDAVHEVTATKQDTTSVLAQSAQGAGHADGTDVPPVPPVVDVLRVTPTRDGNRTVTIRCPWCGRRHVHGLPAGNATVGHRVSHCARDVAHLGYVVVLTPIGVSA